MSDSIDDDDGTTGAAGLAGKIKIAVILFIAFMFVISDVFIERVLTDAAGLYVADQRPTGRGAAIQAAIIAGAYLFADAAISNDFL